MMKKYLFGLLALVLLQHASAQTPKPPSRWSIDLSAGPAIPVGTFANIHNENAHGGVSIGGGIELAGEYRICHHFSAILAFSGQLNAGHGVPGVASDISVQTTRNGASLPLQKDWKLARILAGGVYTIPLTKRSGPELMFRALGGIQQTSTPDYAYDPGDFNTPPGYTGWLKGGGSTLPWAFSYEGDAGIKWNFPGRLTLLAYAGYNGSRPSKKSTGLYANPLNTRPEASPDIKTTLPTGSLLLRAGIAYNL